MKHKDFISLFENTQFYLRMWGVDRTRTHGAIDVGGLCLQIEKRRLCPAGGGQRVVGIVTLGVIEMVMGVTRMVTADHRGDHKWPHAHPQLRHETCSRVGQRVAIRSWGRHCETGVWVVRTGAVWARAVWEVDTSWGKVAPSKVGGRDDDGVSSTEAGSAPFFLTWGARSIRILVGCTHVIHQGLGVQTDFMTHWT